MQYFLLQFRLYKGCYQLMAGANPMQAQAMLNSTGHASFLRKRGSGKVGEGCGMFVCMCQWLCGCMDIIVAGGVGEEVILMLGLVNLQYSKTSEQTTH